METTMPKERTLDLATVGKLVVAGWTGRDAAALNAHIEELAAIGVAPPKSVPIFYRNSAALLTTASQIETVGSKSSGEVEFVLYSLDDGLWVGVGSDHTDRQAETVNVTRSKQMCAKPVSAKLWYYSEVKPHWDRLMLRSHVPGEAGKPRLYQECSVTNMRAPEELIALYTGTDRLPVGTAMFCGTSAVHGAMSYSGSFAMALSDPVLNRSLTHRYEVLQLPDEG
jgi:hypothetical protein